MSSSSAGLCLQKIELNCLPYQTAFSYILCGKQKLRRTVEDSSYNARQIREIAVRGGEERLQRMAQTEPAVSGILCYSTKFDLGFAESLGYD